ncbi:MAG: alpha/beta fold hydrolase [Candidatus Azambacteria bacterium]|nr:alpha/beta fold hydrolase [Candidatus Azambacteria bacterium]
MKTVIFQTKDDVKIVGDFYQSQLKNDERSKKSVLLLHILPGLRRDFNEFAGLLWQQGYNVLNIDERGHGESEAWPREAGSWQEFTERDYDKMIYDVEAAADWLKNKISETELAIIGGSIGANLALLYGAKASPKIVVALSPGLNYKGIKTEIASRNFRKNLLLIASKDDNYAFESSQRLFDISAAAKKEFIKYEDAGHGTRMFNAEPELKQRILDFLSKNF